MFMIKIFGTTTPVGRYPEGATPQGLMDMAGNAWEWMDNTFKEEPALLRTLRRPLLQLERRCGFSCCSTFAPPVFERGKIGKRRKIGKRWEKDRR